MVVRKKILDSKSTPDKIQLSPHLERVRGAIRQLPQEEGDVMENEPSTTTEPGEKSTPKKVKKSVKKTAAKKTPAKKTTAKSPNGADKGTTLAEICKPLKMEPRKARRILRNAGNKVPDAGARWTWAAAGDVAKVKKILEDATAEK